MFRKNKIIGSLLGITLGFFLFTGTSLAAINYERTSGSESPMRVNVSVDSLITDFGYNPEEVGSIYWGLIAYDDLSQPHQGNNCFLGTSGSFKVPLPSGRGIFLVNITVGDSLANCLASTNDVLTLEGVDDPLIRLFTTNGYIKLTTTNNLNYEINCDLSTFWNVFDRNGNNAFGDSGECLVDETYEASGVGPFTALQFPYQYTETELPNLKTAQSLDIGQYSFSPISGPIYSGTTTVLYAGISSLSGSLKGFLWIILPVIIILGFLWFGYLFLQSKK
jgi:hypothetical protein